jgi:hypothetical protein
MVMDTVYDVVESGWFQALLAVLLVAMGVNGVLNPGAWTLTQVPVLSQLTSVLPDVVHQVVAGLVAFAGAFNLLGRLG